MSKMLAVVGSTGTQGGSVIRAVLADPEAKKQFKIRGLTRDPDSKKTEELKKEGVDFVAADLNKLDSLTAAFKNAHAVFAVTNYWEYMSAETEYQQGKNIADAAKANNVQHLVWSTLEDVTKLTNGKYSHVQHFTTKAKVDEYIKSLDIPTTFVQPGFYLTNLDMFMRSTPDGHRLMLPASSTAKNFPAFAPVQDGGKFVKAALLNPSASIGKKVRQATAYITPHEMVETFQKLFPEAGKGAAYVQVSADDYKGGLAAAGMPPAAQEDLCEMMQFIGEFGYYGGAELEESHALLKPEDKLTTLEEYYTMHSAFKDLK